MQHFILLAAKKRVLIEFESQGASGRKLSSMASATTLIEHELERVNYARSGSVLPQPELPRLGHFVSLSLRHCVFIQPRIVCKTPLSSLLQFWAWSTECPPCPSTPPSHPSSHVQSVNLQNHSTSIPAWQCVIATLWSRPNLIFATCLRMDQFNTIDASTLGIPRSIPSHTDHLALQDRGDWPPVPPRFWWLHSRHQ